MYIVEFMAIVFWVLFRIARFVVGIVMVLASILYAAPLQETPLWWFPFYGIFLGLYIATDGFD